MKTLLIRGNPRKNGVTQKLVDLFAEGLKRGGAKLADVNLSDLQISPCKGCFSCIKSPQSECVIKDDIKNIAPMLSECELLVCASPVYFYSMSAQMKIFWDRMFPFICGYETDASNKRKISTNFKVKNKKFLSFNVAGGRKGADFLSLEKTWETLSKSMNFDLIANIFRGESQHIEHPNQHLQRVLEIKENISLAGEQLAKTGNIDKKILKKISADLSESDEVFAYNSNLFWERVKLIKAKDGKAEKPLALLKKMQKNFTPQKENFFISFYFTDTKENFCLEINKDICSLSESENTSFDLKIETSVRAWQSFMDGKSKVMEQLSNKDIRLCGNKHIFAKFKRIFPEDNKPVIRKK